MINQFRTNYRNKFNIKFIGEIPCVAHIINLIVNDIMNTLKLKAAPSDEIAIFINDMEKLAKKRAQMRPLKNQVRIFLIYYYYYYYYY